MNKKGSYCWTFWVLDSQVRDVLFVMSIMKYDTIFKCVYKQPWIIILENNHASPEVSQSGPGLKQQGRRDPSPGPPWQGQTLAPTYFFEHDERDDGGRCEERCDDYHHDPDGNVLVETSEGRDPTTKGQQTRQQANKSVQLSKQNMGSTVTPGHVSILHRW